MTSCTHQGRRLTSYRSILLGALHGVADRQKKHKEKNIHKEKYKGDAEPIQRHGFSEIKVKML